MKKRDLHWLIYLVILLGIPLAVRPAGSLTQLGVYALAITVSTLYAWLTIGSIETSLLYMVLMIVVGVSVSFAQCFLIGIPFTIVMLLVMMLCVALWKPNAPGFQNLDIQALAEAEGPLRKEGKIALGALIFGGAVVAMSTPLSRADVGVTAWMGESMKPLVGSLPPVVIILILVILAVTMTNFLSNVVTMVVFFNIGISVLPQEPLLLAVFGVCIGFASSMATLTPSASIPAHLFFGEGHVTMQNTFKYNMVFVLCAFAAVMLLIYPLAQLVV